MLVALQDSADGLTLMCCIVSCGILMVMIFSTAVLHWSD
jgi:hypothetical protein